MVRGLNALAVSRFTDNPNSTARRNVPLRKCDKIRWTRNGVGGGTPFWQGSNLHLLRFLPSALPQLSYPLLVWRITNDQRPIEMIRDLAMSDRSHSPKLAAASRYPARFL